ncbi:MAG: M28 family metallopeptidase [Armatimonadota bacterium]|nr:M28 family metallopeptidase [Armatimonadota bacterium]
MTDIERADREIIGDIWTSSRAWDTCLEIVQRFPNRYAGHPDEAAAREFVAERCRALGLEARVEEFGCAHWRPGHARLEVLGGADRALEIPCVNLPMNGTARVEAEVVYVEEGTPAQFAAAGEAVRGRIVLVNSRCPSYTHRPRTCRREKYDLAIAAGAAGFIYMRHEGGLVPEVYSLSSAGPAPVPGVSITREAGAALLQRVRCGGRARLDVDNAVEPGRSWNVIADLPGPPGSPAILVGAHYDTLVGCPGAIDDASGVAVLLEAARVLVAHRALLNKGLRFVAFGLEEGGLQGARAYIATHRGELDGIEFMLNVDGAAYGAPEKGIGLQGWPALIPYFKGLASRMGEEIAADVWVTPNSDMHPFMRAAVPCAWLFDMSMSLANLGWPHTAADTIDKVSPRGLRITSLLLSRLLLYMATTPMPAVTRDVRDVEAWLAEWNLSPSPRADR